MPRVKGGTVARKRRKKILKLAKGYYGSKHTLYKTAHEQVMHSLAYAYRDRKQKKRNFRKLWITRINAAARINGMSYSRFMNGLGIAGIELDRKVLSELAVNNPEVFADLAAKAKEALETKGKVQLKTLNVKDAAPQPKKVVKETKEVKEVKEEVASTDVDLNSLSVAELKDLAKEKGISGISKLKKAELIDALK